MGFMACSRRLDQTGMYLKNEYSVFKGHPDFRPYKVSLTRILRFRVGLVGALWLSLQDYIRFVLIFSVSYAVGLGQKKYLVGFPTRHRRRFYPVFCKLVPVYLLVTIWVTANVSKKQRSSQQIRQAVFSFGDIAVLRYSFMAFTKSWGLLKYCFTKSYDFTSCIRRFVLQNSLGFFPERLNWSYALLNRNSSLRESKIRITEICSSNPFRKYYA